MDCYSGTAASLASIVRLLRKLPTHHALKDISTVFDIHFCCDSVKPLVQQVRDYAETPIKSIQKLSTFHNT